MSPQEIESVAHENFSGSHLIGEWFDIDVLEAERFIGASEEAFDGFRWITTHHLPHALRIYTGLTP